MLQLPQRSSGNFTRADLAEISRGAASVKQRAKSQRPKPDPVIKLVARYRTAVQRHKATITDLKAFYASHDPMEVRPAAVYLPPAAMLTIHDSINNREFFAVYEIEIWADNARKYYRAILRGRRTDAESKTISRTAAKDRIADVEKLEPQLKRGLRRQKKITKQRWADSGYQALIDQHHRTYMAMTRARNALRDNQATSLVGLSAVLSLLQDQAWDETCGNMIDGAMPTQCRKAVLANLEKAVAVLIPGAQKQ